MLGADAVTWSDGVMLLWIGLAVLLSPRFGFLVTVVFGLLTIATARH